MQLNACKSAHLTKYTQLQSYNLLYHAVLNATTNQVPNNFGERKAQHPSIKQDKFYAFKESLSSCFFFNLLLLQFQEELKAILKKHNLTSKKVPLL